jgi:hypothetical protein
MQQETYANAEDALNDTEKLVQEKRDKYDGAVNNIVAKTLGPVSTMGLGSYTPERAARADRSYLSWALNNPESGVSRTHVGDFLGDDISASAHVALVPRGDTIDEVRRDVAALLAKAGLPAGTRVTVLLSDRHAGQAKVLSEEFRGVTFERIATFATADDIVNGLLRDQDGSLTSLKLLVPVGAALPNRFRLALGRLSDDKADLIRVLVFEDLISGALAHEMPVASLNEMFARRAAVLKNA